MMHSSALSKLNREKFQDRPRLNVVVAYEDEASGQVAKEVSDLVLNHLAGRTDCDCHLWRFDLLERSQANQLAFHDAVGADLVIIVAHGTGELPRGVRKWIEESLPKKENSDSVLMTILESPSVEKGGSRVFGYLENVAVKTGMQFVPQLLDPMEFQRGSTQGRERATSLLERNLYPRPRVRGWGINE